ncbi:SusD/RagB family nutrient-binding outer membrane lipoprotein [Lutibacter sp.]|uniref:SusD/RagB family nutrient-binding outer membrane lipoprotein n=1 Tax=Lutibacter sp. TaxID=1925666 RepID=UPI002734063F|nr:SusD/RagB family nutrient-binding outer membrane lipoprotein [Lutibacter sp.]MDP3313034.1 SusD/RagB family nutrient-binding outer membrane lipoprotein [Lutibacter sp.]
MKKFIIKIIIISLLVVGITACSNEYFDVNTPSGTAQPDQLRMNDLLAPVIHSSFEGQLSAELTFGNYVQNFVSQGGGAAGETEAAGLWSQVYLYILPNLKVIKEKAVVKGAIHYGAVADILTAINIGIATDTWDNIPYSQATQAPQNLFPAFDSQEFIYTEIFRLLDGAIIALESVDNSGIKIGREDLVYRGDKAKWLRAAYTIKARYQLHLTKINGTAAATNALASIAKGFTSNSDDFQMFYDAKKINPWYSSEILARNTGNFHRDIASQLVSSMNGDYFPFQSGLLVIDPRLPRFATNNGAATWKGFVSGSGKAPDGTAANTFFVENGYYTSINSPLVIISYAEAMFIKAEAAFIVNGGTPTSIGSTSTAQTAYMSGIAASMSKYGVNGTNYMADASVNVGTAGLKLEHIMKEKYIHNFLNPEAFVDFRRYNFSNQVFKGLKIREELLTESNEYKGLWFRRASYPSIELNRNSTNVLANRKAPTESVWWAR